MNLTTFEILVLCEAIVAIIIVMIIIAVAASIKRYRKGKDKLYDPYGLYATITPDQLAEMDMAATYTCARAAQLLQNTQNARSEESLQSAQNAQDAQNKQ